MCVAPRVGALAVLSVVSMTLACCSDGEVRPDASISAPAACEVPEGWLGRDGSLSCREDLGHVAFEREVGSQLQVGCEMCQRTDGGTGVASCMSVQRAVFERGELIAWYEERIGALCDTTTSKQAAVFRYSYADDEVVCYLRCTRNVPCAPKCYDFQAQW